MKDYEHIEKEIDKNKEKNEKYIEEFEKWLIEKDFGDKTIRKHISNVDLFINGYLNYYNIIKAENGMDEIYDFINDWFIYKCMWSSKNSIKETVASLKKFYKYMSENNYVSVNDYKEMCSFIKDSMDDFYQTLDNYENEAYFDIF